MSSHPRELVEEKSLFLDRRETSVDLAVSEGSIGHTGDPGQRFISIKECAVRDVLMKV